MKDDKKLTPLPFSLALHGIGYDIKGTNRGAIFDNQAQLKADLIRVAKEHLIDDVEADIVVAVHAYMFRPEWT